MCEYAFYNEKEKKSQIYCKINGKICLFSKFCIKQNKYIHREGVENCYMALEEKKNNIPNGAYRVRFVHKGFAYVEITENYVVKIKDTLGNIDNYVYLKNTEQGYILSLSPFIDEEKKEETEQKPKRNNRKKK